MGAEVSKNGMACLMPPPVSSRAARSSLMRMSRPKWSWASRYASIWSAKWWTLTTMREKPASRNRKMTCAISGLSPTLTSALGMVSVSGLRRVPKPAAKIIACFMDAKLLQIGGRTK